MQAFIKIDKIIAPMELNNIDTDMIIPKQFLKTINRTGLGKNLFHEMRYDMDDQEVPNFILNQEPYRQAGIIIAGENFGCGSSREHAPWALFDFGISCIIAPSFADIFYNNCFKNGILPVILKANETQEITQIVKDNKGIKAVVDLPQQEIHLADKIYKFNIDASRKKCLLEGLDDIALTLQHEEKISEFEAKDKLDKPWLWQ
jgi:3-isopropylmalate/(R)-2-methylmalate dehydratase small subunit